MKRKLMKLISMQTKNPKLTQRERDASTPLFHIEITHGQTRNMDEFDVEFSPEMRNINRYCVIEWEREQIGKSKKSEEKK